jgi:hypothetical protein
MGLMSGVEKFKIVPEKMNIAWRFWQLFGKWKG